MGCVDYWELKLADRIQASTASTGSMNRYEFVKRNGFRWTFGIAIFLLCSSSQSSTAQLFSGGPQDSEDRIQVAAMVIDSERVKAAGIGEFSGQHVTLYTDLRDAQKAQQLVSAFDDAVPQWCREFGVALEQVRDWKMNAILLTSGQQGARFRQAGLMPAGLPNFPAGFQSDENLWLFAQPGDYYTRHLLLHEGTHGFMQRFAGGYGAPWYSEGMAELLALHRFAPDDQLQIKYRITDRDEVPFWGRVKVIREAVTAKQAMTLDDVLQIPPNAFRDVEYYAWSWAGCEFFRHHPLSQRFFNALTKQAELDTDRFNLQFRQSLEEHWATLARDWELFVAEMDYGIEVERVRLIAAENLGAEKFRIRADHGWQSTGISVQAEAQIRITANGRYVVGQTVSAGKTYPWHCQPNGITIEYYRGQPLGQLQVGILLDESNDRQTPRQRVSGLTEPIPVGDAVQLTAPAGGEICFRINESPARLRDNQGALEVIVETLK